MGRTIITGRGKKLVGGGRSRVVGSEVGRRRTRLGLTGGAESATDRRRERAEGVAMIGLRLLATVATWALGAVGPATVAVVQDRLGLFDGPNGAAFATGEARRGDRLVVRRDVGGGWLAVEPPRGAFSLIDEE